MNQLALDPVIFNELKDLMDDAMADFIDTYLDNSPKLIDKMTQGLADNDTELVFESAHQLKGGSGSIGAMQLYQLSLDIEQLGKTGSTDGIEPVLDRLKAEFDKVKLALQAEL